MSNFWNGFDKTAAKSRSATGLLDKIRLGLKHKMKNFSIKGIHKTKAGKKL